MSKYEGFNSPTTGRTPEEKLWFTVLLTMLADATKPVREGVRVRKGGTEHECVMAREMIRNNDPGFQNICWLCGLDPAPIREKFMAGKISHKRLIQGKHLDLDGRQPGRPPIEADL